MKRQRRSHCTVSARRSRATWLFQISSALCVFTLPIGGYLRIAERAYELGEENS